MSPLRKEQFLIRLLAVHTTAFFPPLYFYFNFLLKRRSLTSNVTPTATQNSVSPPRGTHHSTFYRLSTSILTSFLKRRCLTSKVTPTPIRHSDSPPRLTYGTIFSHLSTSILTFSWSGGALRRMSQLRKNQIPILLLALPILVFFAASLLYFNFLFRRWSLTFNVTPKPTLNSDSTPRVTHHSFFRLSTSILNFSWSSGALPPTSPYIHIRFGFPSTPYLHYNFYPPLYLHFKFFLKRRCLTSNVTPTTTTDSNSPPRLTYLRFFPPLYLQFNFFLEAAEPNLQSNTYTNIRFGFHLSLYPPNDLYPPL